MEQILTKYGYFLGFLDSRIGGRPENQDSFGYVETPDGLLVIVCDGMGGGPGGKTASSTVVEVVKQSIIDSSHHHKKREDALKIAIERAHDVLLNKMQENPSLKGMGTTIAALYINSDSAVLLHIGDSRIYKLRGGERIFRTQDHSMVGEMVRNGTLTEEQARLSAQSNIITRAIGIDGRNLPDISVVPFEKGDRFVLCSDGIWGSMPEPQLIKCFSEHRSISNIVESLSTKVDSIGRDKGNTHDNLTLAIVETKIDSKLKENMNRKAKIIIGAVGLLLVVSLIFNMFQSCSTSKNLSRENEIEELKTALQEKDSEIQAWKDSVGILKQRELQLKDEVKRNKEIIKRNSDLERRMDGLDSEMKSLQQKQREVHEEKENNKEKVSTSSKTSPSFEETKKGIVNILRELTTLKAENDGALRTQIMKRKEKIDGLLKLLKSKYPDKTDTIDKIQKAIVWKDIDHHMAPNGELTRSGKTKVNKIIDNLNSIK